MEQREFTLLDYPIAEDSIRIYISNGDTGLVEEFFRIRSEFTFKEFQTLTDHFKLTESLKESGTVTVETIIDRYYFPKETLIGKCVLSLDFSFKEFISIHGEFLFFLKLSDSAFVVDSAGTGEDRDILFVEPVSFNSIIYLEKLNFISWKNHPLKHPFISLLYYGKIIHFKDIDEFNEFENNFFKERLDALCPVCGKPKGKHLKFGFFDTSVIPQHYYVCSKECLREFARRSTYYIALLKKSGTNP